MENSLLCVAPFHFLKVAFKMHIKEPTEEQRAANTAQNPAQTLNTKRHRTGIKRSRAEPDRSGLRL